MYFDTHQLQNEVNKKALYILLLVKTCTKGTRNNYGNYTVILVSDKNYNRERFKEQNKRG